MKVTVKKPVEIEISHVRIEVPVRYEEEVIPNDFPLRDGKMWRATVELDTGKIVEWPEDKPEEYFLSLKVCDEGIYKLIDPNGNQEGRTSPGDYVPHGVIPGEYGDYINLEIEGGIITNWPKKPDVSAFFEDED